MGNAAPLRLVAAAILSAAVAIGLYWRVTAPLAEWVTGLCGFLMTHGLSGPGGVSLSILACIGLMSLAGAVRAGLAQLHATRRFVRRTLKARCALPPAMAPLTEKLGLVGRIDVVEAPAPLSFCYGFARPRICVSRALVDRLTPAELEAVLRHERCHLRRRDPLRLLLVRGMCAGLFFLPVVHHLRERLRATSELGADRTAIAEQRDPVPLASALYKLLAQPGASHPPADVLVGALGVTDRRIDQLLLGEAAPMAPVPVADLALTAAALALVAGLSLTPVLFATAMGSATVLSNALSPVTCLGVLALGAFGLASARRGR